MSKKHNKVYIYTLSDCRTPELVKYVGKTQYLKERLIQHKRSCMFKYSKVSLWIKNVLLENSDIFLNVIDEVEENEWEKAEIAYIKLYKSFGANLTNTANGGNDMSYARKYVKKRRKNFKQSILMKGNTIWKNVSKETRLLAAKKANETKQKNGTKYVIKKLSLEQSIKQKQVLLQNSINLSNPIVEVDYNFNIIKEYCSISNAQKILKIKGISGVCTNNRCFVNKKIFMYKNFTEIDKINKLNKIMATKRTAKIYLKQINDKSQVLYK